MRGRLTILALCLVLLLVTTESVAGSAILRTSATSPTVTVGMPFAGKWAYNQKVLPPYVDTCPGGGYSCPGLSSHPSVHKTDGGGDWATDLYAAAGTPVRLHVTASSGALSYAWRSSSGCPSSTMIELRVDGVPVGTIYYTHLQGAVRSGPITDGMRLGTVADPSTDGNCNPGLHVHIELKNSQRGSYACWTEHGNPGVTLAESTTIGVLGSSNTAKKQTCAAAATTPTSAAVTHAYLQWLGPRYPNAVGFWACPITSFDDAIEGGGYWCVAELGRGRQWHRLDTVTLISGQSIVFLPRLGSAVSRDRSWIRRWSPWTARVIRGFNVPGRASTNGAQYDWPLLASAAYHGWQHHQTVFRAQGVERRPGGLDGLYLFTCHVYTNLVQCANSLGDSMRYAPRRS